MGSEIALKSNDEFQGRSIRKGMFNGIRYANVKDLCRELLLNANDERMRIDGNINLKGKHTFSNDGQGMWITLDGIPTWLLGCPFEPNSEEYDFAQYLIQRLQRSSSNQISIDPTDNNSLIAAIPKFLQLLQDKNEENIRLTQENQTLKKLTHNLEDFLDTDNRFGIRAAYQNIGQKYFKTEREFASYIRDVLGWGKLDENMQKPETKACIKFVRKGYVVNGIAPPDKKGICYPQFQILSKGMTELQRHFSEVFDRKQLGA
jgi:hypothetical protein